MKLFDPKTDRELYTPISPEERAELQKEGENVGGSFFKDGVRRFMRNKTASLSLFAIIILSLLVILLPAVWPYGYDDQLGVQLGLPVDASYNNLAPFEYGETERELIADGERLFPHIFGTDSSGRDYFIRVIYGARISLGVGFFASIIVLLVGLTVGAVSGYLGGNADLFIMRIVDIIYSLPDMLMVILLSSVLSAALGNIGGAFERLGTNMISLFFVFALLYWVSMARLIRGQVLSVKEQEYVIAAKTFGAGGGRIIRRHLLPNAIGVIIVSTALQIPSAIFTESYLSFLGLGVNAPMPSLGSLASDALNGIESYPSRLIFPAAVISLTVLALNLIGDGLRDSFDPSISGSR